MDEERTKPRLINTFDQCKAAGGDRIAILYKAGDYGRGGTSACVLVARIKDGREVVTDPKAHFLDYGRKAFPVHRYLQEGPFHLAKREAIRQAMEWACQKYGPREFAKNRMRDYVEKEVNERFPIPKRKKEP